ncbi:MAG: hypothetical protein KH366_24820 [Clostridiaceae bacterium]|nr:hypothetical protein [Clostridiaceae bacterium]
MGVQLLSVSYKTTPIEIRSLFAFNEEQQERILEGLCSHESIEEAVVLSTCNRMEVYCYSNDGADASKVFEQMLGATANKKQWCHSSVGRAKD